MIINGIDYDKREAELAAAGIPWDGTDDTVFDASFVFCNQHLRAHSVGWCTVSNVEKVALQARTHEVAEIEAEEMRAAAVRLLAPVGSKAYAVTLAGVSCVVCGQPLPVGEEAVYNSDREPRHRQRCEPSEEYATEQMRRLGTFLERRAVIADQTGG